MLICIKEITPDKDEAEKLLEVHKTTVQKVKEVEENLAESIRYQKRVAEMAEEMSDTTNRSREQVENIGKAMEQQTELAKGMEKAFEEVQNISDTLLQISLQQNS